MNNAKGRATFLLFVYTKEPTDVLSGKVLEVYTKFYPCVVSISNVLSFLCQAILPYVEGVADVAPAPFISASSPSDSGLSGGEVAAIVIVILVLVIIALIATVIIL